MNRFACAIAALASIGFGLSLRAEPPATAAPPAFPLPGYRDYQTLTRDLQNLARPPIVTIRSLTTTTAGREMPLLTLAHGEHDKKPAILIMGNVHAPLLHGAEIATRMAQRLAADTPENQALLERFTIYIITVPDPDATAAMFAPPFMERTTNLRPTDDDHDGDLDEDGPDDLNHDGLITMIRVEDPAGTWMPHPTDPRILIEADGKKDERGKYKLYGEGIDNDHDGQFNEDGAGGVAFDRNFPFEYSYFGEGAGPNQVSEPQTRAVAQFVIDHPNIAAVFSFSDEDNLENAWKPGAGSKAKVRTNVAEGDAPYFEHIAERYREIHKAKDAPAPADGHGSFVQWVYYDTGRWSFAARGWWVPQVKTDEPADEKDDAKKDDAKKDGTAKDDKKRKTSPDKRGADQLNALRWLASQKIDGFVPWTPIDHPDFPGKKVEVGGFKPLVLLNPPADQLEGLADEHTQFIRQLAEMMPRVSIGDVKVEPLGESVYRITAAIVNDGYLPTLPDMGKISDVPWALELTLDLPANATLIKGLTHDKLDPIAGKGGRTEAVWLLRTDAANVTLHVGSPATGSDTKTVKLQ